jgi:WD40 repeat protein
MPVEDQYVNLAFDELLTTVFAIDGGWRVDRWNLTTGNQEKRLRPNNAYAEPRLSSTILDVAPQGESVATRAAGGKLEILDARTGEQVAILADQRGSFSSAEFIDAYTLLGMVDDGLEPPAWAAGVWDIQTSRMLYKFPGDESRAILLAVGSVQNVFAVGAASTIDIYDLRTGAFLAELNHAKDINMAAFSPNGRLLASICHRDDSVRIWDWVREAEVHTLTHYGATQSGVAFSPDGRTIATGEHTGPVRLWNVETGHEMIRLPIEGMRIDCSFRRTASGLHAGFDEYRRGGTKSASGRWNGDAWFWPLDI